MKRTSILVLGVIAVLALFPGVASAKIPPFTVEASPNDPTAGDTVRLTVRFWDDADHTDPARWVDFRLKGFLWAHPAGSVEEAASIDLRLVRPGVYRAEMNVGSPGRWILCPWQRRCGGDQATPGFPGGGYPDRIELDVASAAPDPVASALAGPSSSPSRMPVPLLSFVAAAVAAAILLGRSVGRSSHLRR